MRGAAVSRPPLVVIAVMTGAYDAKLALAGRDSQLRVNYTLNLILFFKGN